MLSDLKLNEDSILFAIDKPIHDLKYVFEASSAVNGLGWRPRFAPLQEVIKDLVRHEIGLNKSGPVAQKKISRWGLSVSSVEE